MVSERRGDGEKDEGLVILKCQMSKCMVKMRRGVGSCWVVVWALVGACEMVRYEETVKDQGQDLV